jgi:hypothetical protein
MTAHFLLGLVIPLLLAGQAVCSPAPAVPAKARPADDPDEMICKHVIPTGTRIGEKRVCQSRAHWAVLARDSRDAADDLELRSDQVLPPGH